MCQSHTFSGGCTLIRRFTSGKDFTWKASVASAVLTFSSCNGNGDAKGKASTTYRQNHHHHHHHQRGMFRVVASISTSISTPAPAPARAPCPCRTLRGARRDRLGAAASVPRRRRAPHASAAVPVPVCVGGWVGGCARLATGALRVPARRPAQPDDHRGEPARGLGRLGLARDQQRRDQHGAGPALLRGHGQSNRTKKTKGWAGGLWPWVQYRVFRRLHRTVA